MTRTFSDLGNCLDVYLLDQNAAVSLLRQTTPPRRYMHVIQKGNPAAKGKLKC